jgi:hypothetical protein
VSFQSVHAGSCLHEEALRVVAHVNGEAGPHGVVRGAAAARQVPRLEGQFGDVRIVQRMANLFEDETGCCLEVQDAYELGKTSLDISG